MNYLKLALLVLMCLSIAACAAKQPQNPATTEASTEWRIKNLEESFLNFREEQRNQVSEAQEGNAALEKRLVAIELELAALKASGMSDASETPEDMAAETGTDWVNELKTEPGDEGWVDSEQGAGEKKVMEPSVAQSDEEKPWEKVPGSIAATPAPKAEPKKMAPKPAPKKVAKSKAKKASKPAGQAMYNAALAKYNSEKYDQAREGFDAFIAKYPKSSLVPNALYWKGETYYSQKSYPQAILAFKNVTTQYPKHAKAAAALLKIGMSYDRVGDPDNAIFYLRALLEDFPKSAPAKLGRQELTRLGG